MRFIATLVFAALVSNSASSETVYNNGTYGPTASSVTSIAAADDFKLAKDALIDNATFYAFTEFGENAPWDGTLDYAIFSNDKGLPGMLLTSGKGQDIKRKIIGDWGGAYGPQFQFDFSFEQSFLAKADTVYWFVLHLGEKYGGHNWFWNFIPEKAVRHGEYAVTSAGAGMSNWWNQHNRDRAFTLGGSTSAVPELPAIALLATGGVALSVVRKLLRATKT